MPKQSELARQHLGGYPVGRKDRLGLDLLKQRGYRSMICKTIRGLALVVMVATGSTASLMSTQAWAADESSHMDQSERMDRIEARLLKLEASSNKQSGMMEHMMKDKQPMSEHDMSGPMGTMPQSAAPMSPAAGAAGGGMGGDM